MKIVIPIKNLEVKSQDGAVLVFNDCTLRGEILVQESNGPFGIREFVKASFLNVQFDFEHLGNEYRYQGILSEFDLMPEGKEVTAGDIDPTSNILSPEIQAVVDTRDDLQIQRDNKIELLRLKYADSRFQLFELNGSVSVKWNLYNQNISDYENVHYQIGWNELLFLNATKLYLDGSGEVEDFDPHGESFCNITKL